MVHWNHMKITQEISIYSLFAKSRRLFCILWQNPTSYGSHISLAGLFGVLGLILAVRDGRIMNWNRLLLSTAGSSLNKPSFVPGLRNLGNNCFLNVILQALASCSRFRHFLKEHVRDLQSSLVEDPIEGFPLSVALASLFEELCRLQDERKTLNPRELMLAMQLYTPQFTLSNQQDAAEAFLLLLCCLREEFAESYVPKCGSWANVATPSDRVVMPERREELSEPERWRQRYLGPFDGILGSFLTCQSCSSEIIMDFDFFHTLALSPRVDGCASIAHGCTIEDCIRSFLAAEQVESYHCNHCWHLAAIKYLSFFEGQEEEIRKLHCCTAQDSCDCRNLSSLQTLPWSNCISRTFKQLSIAHCPKILCLQIQRVSINIFGELVKLQGHIRFPFVLDLSPFVKNQVGIRKAERDITKPVASQQIQPSISRLDYIGISEYAVSEPRGDPTAKAFLEVDSSQVGGCLDAEINHTLFNNEVMSGAPSPDSHKYHLVSVVEHWGRANGGHYTVYRGVRTEPDDEDGPGRMDSGPLEWFRVSDSEVYHASEEDVLAADASLLFYERTTN